MQTINVNLALLKGAYIADLPDGRKAVVVPADSAFIPQDQKSDKPVASVSLNLWTHLPNQWGYCISVKQAYRQAELDAMTEAERRAIPFIGRGK